MPKKKRGHRGRPQGHYCKVCGEYKANEKFSGKGHAAHICKTCSQLSAATQAEAMTINRLMSLPMGRLSAGDKGWLENRLHDQRSEVASLAKEIYSLHFPFAERNARKKRLTINKLVYELHTTFFDGWGDELPVNKRFTADRASRTLTMTDFDADGVERSMELDGGKMSTLLRWTVHTLEIFMWPGDYDLDPALLSGCFLDDWDEDTDDDPPRTPLWWNRRERPAGGYTLSMQTTPRRRSFLFKAVWMIAQRTFISHCWNISNQKQTNLTGPLPRMYSWNKDIII